MRLDGELSELEAALLDKHLDSCLACASFDDGLRVATRSLRLTPPEPARLSIGLPQRELPAPVGRRKLVVAAIAAALALGSIVGSSLHRPAADTNNREPQVSLLTRDIHQLREIPRGKHYYPTAPAREPGEPPEGLI